MLTTTADKSGLKFPRRTAGHMIVTCPSAQFCIGANDDHSTATIMGVDGLWQIVSPAIKKRSFMDLAITEGFIRNPRGDHMFRIGIDASIYMHQAGHPFVYNHTQAGQSPELRLLFSRMAYFLKYPVMPIFVFDGAGRPPKKRGKAVGTKPHWLTRPFQVMIKAFGFYFHEAPGEAEAELAALSKRGVVDAVITNDGDALIHGARVVIKIPNIKEQQDEIDVVSLDDIERAPVSLSQGSLMLYAILRGGDYDDGLAGCGPEIAHGLARSNLGNRLLHALRTMTGPSLHAYLADWLQDLRHMLQNDPLGMLGRRYPSLAGSIAPDFPDLAVVRLYTDPLISQHTSRAFASSKEWIIRQPNLPEIASFCEQHFTWGTESDLPGRLEHLIFPSCMLRMLCQPVSEADVLVSYFAIHSSFNAQLDRGSVLQVVHHQPDLLVPTYSLRVSTTAFTNLILSGLTPSRKMLKPSAHRVASKRKCVEIPTHIVQLALPRMVEAFHDDSHPAVSSATSSKVSHYMEVPNTASPDHHNHDAESSEAPPSSSSLGIIDLTSDDD